MLSSKEQREKDFHNKSFYYHTREAVGKYYSIARSRLDFYEKLLLRHCQGKRVLECGCGPGSYSFFLAKHNAIVTGIDISDVAINQAIQRAKNENIDVCFRIMNAEKLEFGNATFDVICGTGILHHLDIQKALSELARTLKPNGMAIFIEPLGHNPLINFYRKVTPHLRTEDEHPLLKNDLKTVRKYFQKVEPHFFDFSSLIAVPFRKFSFFPNLVNTFHATDRLLFKFIPFMKRYAWMVVLILTQPDKTQID